MSDSAVRLLRLLGLLERQPAWSGADLAERLGVDGRTVRRDVERLRDLGYRIEASRGSSGGYRLVEGTDVPPLLLDDEEAMAVAVVLGASAGAAVPGVEHGALGAFTKLDRLLPARLRSQIAALRASVESLASPPRELVSVEALVLLAQACESHQRVTFSYRAQDGRESDRRVEPHRLVATDRRWYLLAYDLDRDDWRTFRVDRLGAVTIPGHTFEPRPLADPGRMVTEAIAAAPYRYRVVVRVEAPPERLERLVTRNTAIVEADGDHTRLELGTDGFEWLTGYLIGLSAPFEVLEPDEFRAYLADLGERLQRSHDGAGRRALTRPA